MSIIKFIVVAIGLHVYAGTVAAMYLITTKLY